MWQRFTERARKAVFYAQEEAVKWNQPFVSPEHLLLGLIREDDSFAVRILDRIGISRDIIRAEVERQMIHGEGGQGKDLQLTPRAKKVVDLAYAESGRLKNNYIGGEHLLLGLIAEGEGLAARVLTELGMTLETTREQVQKSQEDGAIAKAASEELLSLDEAVKFLGTSKPTLYRLLGQDEIKGLKVGRQWRFRKVDLIAYMERGPVAVAAAPQGDLDVELAFFAAQLGQEASDLSAMPRPRRSLSPIKSFGLPSRQGLRTFIWNRPLLTCFCVTGWTAFCRRHVGCPLACENRSRPSSKSWPTWMSTKKRCRRTGAFPVKYEDKDFDLRVSSVPCLFGESLVLRILNRSEVLIGLDKLGLAPEDFMQIRDWMHLPNGIVIATGPNGSGKTTLLYSCLQEVADSEKKTMTLEDPVEYVLPHTTQVQVNKKAGLTFASALRSMRRQDPDIILVGEMRDLETAQISLEVALTGHLVLTGLPAGDAPSALLRLIEMGLEPYLVSATVKGVVAMRLCRRVCESCKQPVNLSAAPALSYLAPLAAEGGYDIPPDAVFVRGAGCEQCRGRGYRGRIGLYEALTMSEAVTEALLRRASGEELTTLAAAGGMRTLLADGIRKAVEGQTTVEEVLRVVSVLG